MASHTDYKLERLKETSFIEIRVRPRKREMIYRGKQMRDIKGKEMRQVIVYNSHALPHIHTGLCSFGRTESKKPVLT